MNELSENIKKYRIKNGWTQSELSKILNISSQAISKWELGKAEPDMVMVGKLANIFDIDINELIGFVYDINKKTIYDDEYSKEDLYWDNNYSSMCLDILQYKPPIREYTILNIGCGEGQNAVFLSKCGYKVTAFDISKNAISKAGQLAKDNNVDVEFFIADINGFKLKSNFDIIISSGILQYVDVNFRNEFMKNLCDYTNDNGLHVHNTFIKKPFIEDPPENEPIFNYWKSGELFTYYTDWEILNCKEYIFDCNSSGINHKHCMNKVIALKNNIYI